MNTMICNQRLSKNLFKILLMLTLGYLLTAVLLWYRNSYRKVAIKTLQEYQKTRAITSKPVHFKTVNTSIPMNYYPSHKAHVYPLSILPDPYIIRNKEACKNMSDLKYIVIVISASDHFKERNNIRRTWGSLSHYRQGEVKVVFILGRPNSELYQKAIEAESRNYHDIVQGKFIDTYKNLTHKAVLVIRWVNEHCLNSKMVIKVDDDMVVNFFKLFKMIGNGKCCQKPMEIMCNLHQMGDAIIYRKGSGSIDDEYFPNLKTYPFPFCDGAFLLIPTGTIPILYETAKQMPVFWVDDVYLTGIVVSQLNQLQLKHVKGIFTFKFISKQCFLVEKAKCSFLAGVSVGIKDSQYIWSLMLKYYNGDLGKTY